jgi:hypothetical protein
MHEKHQEEHAPSASHVLENGNVYFRYLAKTSYLKMIFITEIF